MLTGITLRLAALIAAGFLTGCGSTPAAELPPAARPDVSPPLETRPAGRVLPVRNLPERIVADPVRAVVGGGRAIAVVRPRERVLELYDSDTRERIGRAPAGAGPTHVVAGDGSLAYVIDTAGDGLLVFETRGELRIRRRYALPGAPHGIAADPRSDRLWVTLTARNRLLELATGARTHRVASYPTVRQPNEVAIDRSSGRVFVTGAADGVLQLLDPRRSR
jgi:DNA-binding beta-propeller fold protein YncE